jgi:DNA-binding MarR family transcriptional regulator
MDTDFPARPLLGLLLRLAYQHHSQEIEAALRENGFDDVHPAAANVFTFVRPEGITVSELADLARVRKQTMAQAVDQLERTGYVERRPNPRDRRSRLVFLTRRGASVTPSPSRCRAGGRTLGGAGRPPGAGVAACLAAQTGDQAPRRVGREDPPREPALIDSSDARS